MASAPVRARLFPLGLLAGCVGPMAVPYQHRAHVAEHELHCARATMGRSSPYRMPLAGPVADAEQAKLLDVLPREARRTARAAGLEPLLLALLELAREPASPERAIRSLELRQELSLRLLAFDAQLTALAFETACTRRRVETLVRALDEREGARQFVLAASSLVFGASTGIAAGVWSLADNRSNTPAVMSVVGGAITAGLGAAALLVPERAVILEHAHNLLRPVVDGDDPEHLYPSFVFRMLTLSFPGDGPAPRSDLLLDFDRILRRNIAERDVPRAREVLFGTSGVYARELLETRAAMLQALESAVAGVARELELLNRALVRNFASNALPV